MAVSATPPKRPNLPLHPQRRLKLKIRRVTYCTSEPTMKAMGTLRKMPIITSSALLVFR